ncbi:MAG TPA: hybrid sensor histidine kinase/response regulator [Opitutaceae bacterium]|nr:hybrid sensor histidine kinase/response regulator [Opitutaceae bacterium]
MSTDPHPPPASILVVDDTPANLRLLANMLRDGGYKVRPVSSGEMALRVVEATPPDLILLDITMPDIDGYEVCRRLKADERWRDIPVLFISALTDTADKIRAFQAGGVDYVGKPFQFEEVDARVRTHLELRRKELALEANLTRLKELELQRDTLTHMIAHDMRSPLLALQLSVELLAELVPGHDPEAATLVAAARTGAAQVVEMVSQMLDVSRLESGKMELHREPADLVGIARAAIDTLRPLAAARTLALAGAATAPAAVDGDLIRRVVVNLVANAIKFTAPSGAIRIEIVPTEGQVRLAVTDDGPGIPPEQHNRIFEKFGQTAAGARQGGSGLGLAFCKMAVEAHGGGIGVESAPGRGSTFWFSLPASPAPT